MTEHLAADAIRAFVVLIYGDEKKDRGLMSREWAGLRHLADCRIGQSVDGYSGPVGAPCSKRCASAREALALAGKWADSVEAQFMTPQQLNLLEEAS